MLWERGGHYWSILGRDVEDARGEHFLWEGMKDQYRVQGRLCIEQPCSVKDSMMQSRTLFGLFTLEASRNRVLRISPVDPNDPGFADQSPGALGPNSNEHFFFSLPPCMTCNFASLWSFDFRPTG